MRKCYAQLERIFEKITFIITAVIGNSITFILAVILVIFWLTNRNYSQEPINDDIRDIIQGVAFLTLFIIQKAFNHFSASLHIKLNELVSSTESANNAIINVESKSVMEIKELQKEYDELAAKIDDVENLLEDNQTDKHPLK